MKTGSEKVKPLTDQKVFELAAKYQKAHTVETKAGADKTKIKLTLVGELVRRGVQKLTERRSGLTVTLVTPESVEYDEEGIWRALTARQRPKVFDRRINLSKLPPDVVKKLMEELVKNLSVADRKLVIEHSLNEAKLLKAIEDDVVSSDVLHEHSTVVQANSYVRISGGVQ